MVCWQRREKEEVKENVRGEDIASGAKRGRGRKDQS